METNHLGEVINEWELKNKPESMKFCEIIEYTSGNVFLDWRGKDCGGESGFFLSMRACKKYVSQHVIHEKSLWVKIKQ